MSPDGFPIVPTETNFAQWKKIHLTEAIRTYLNAHYSKTKVSNKRKPVYLYNTIELASGSTRSVPFKAIQADNSRFIQSKYLPQHIIIKEVKNMQREHVIKFLEHARERQETYGYQDAFRFTIYIKKQKEYPSLYLGVRPPTRSKKTTNSKKKKTTKSIEQRNNIHPDIDENDDENANLDLRNDEEDRRLDPLMLGVDTRTHADPRLEPVENHGTPAVGLATPTASPKGKTKATDVDPTDCPGNESMQDSAAGIESTSGAAAASCTEASKPRYEKRSRNSKVNKPFVLLNKQSGSPKKKAQVGRSDALAIEEAKKLLATPSKRRR
jgi:hypothetical protein